MKVLIVDPDATRASDLRLALATNGVEVTIAPSGSFALTMLEWNRHDVVVSRARIDDMDGRELCAILKSDPGTRAVRFVLVAAPDEVSAAQTTAAGVDLVVPPALSATAMVPLVLRVVPGAEPKKTAPPPAALSSRPLVTPASAAAARRPAAPAAPVVPAPTTRPAGAPKASAAPLAIPRPAAAAKPPTAPVATPRPATAAKAPAAPVVAVPAAAAATAPVSTARPAAAATMPAPPTPAERSAPATPPEPAIPRVAPVVPPTSPTNGSEIPSPGPIVPAVKPEPAPDVPNLRPERVERPTAEPPKRYVTAAAAAAAAPWSKTPPPTASATLAAPSAPPVNLDAMPSGTFQGTLEIMDLAELTQAIAMGGKKGRLILALPQGGGVVAFEGGQVVHAEYRGTIGEAAFAALLAAVHADPAGRFCFLPCGPSEKPSPTRTIDKSVDRLLISIATAIDEKG